MAQTNQHDDDFQEEIDKEQAWQARAMKLLPVYWMLAMVAIIAAVILWEMAHQNNF